MKPIGPYSPTRQAGNQLYVSGQISPRGDIATQATAALQNLQQLVTNSGFELVDVMQCTIFLTDMADFTTVNKVYVGFWPTPYPTRQTVAVKELPANALVEISCVAVKEAHDDNNAH